MNKSNVTQIVIQDFKVNLKIKLAALWTCFMFFYIYVDYFHLYMPMEMENIRKGRVFEFDISQGFLLMALISVTIPAMMIFLSLMLPSKMNRCMNIIIGSLYIPYSLFNLVGVAWIHMVYAAIVEVIILCLIIHFTWKWPRIETNDI